MHRQRLFVTALWTLVLCVYGAALPAFKDVSREKGLLSFDEIFKDIDNNNKYWGSTIADLDRDGKYDIFVSNHRNSAELYFQKPDMTYNYVHPKLRFLDLHATAAADIDNDGYLDFLINVGGSRGNNVMGHPYVFLTDADQSIARKTGGKENRDLIGLGSIAHRGRAMMFLDMNGDGYLDLLFLNQKNQSATYSHLVYENLGDGNFAFRNNTGIEESPGYWGHVIDVNNDSFPDILILKWDGIELYLGTGEFRFEVGTHLIPEAAAGLNKMKRVRCVAEIDYDGDGDMDLILARGSTSPTGGDDDLLLENVNGVFTSVPNPGFVAKRDHFHVTVGDFNNDGFMDMYFSVMTQFKENRKPDWMYLNEGDGTFSLAPAHGTENTKADSDGDNANAFDYNLDGRIDLLVGSRNDAWKLYENTSRRRTNHYLLVRVGEPRGKIARPAWFNRKALGALVRVVCNGKVFLQRVGSPGQSHSQSYMDTLHFGLGQCTNIDFIEIRYQNEVVVKRTSVEVDQLVTIGRYFPCPSYRLGEACDERMTPCSRTPCEDDDECETVELVGGKCMEQLGCDLSATPEPMQVLENGGFENDLAWKATGSAQYSTADSTEGVRSMQLRQPYAEAKQIVTLQAGLEYTLMCDEKGDPIRYKIRKNGSAVTLWKNFDEPDIPIENSNFMSKKLMFTPTETADYVISLVAPDSQASFVDNCKLFTFGADEPKAGDDLLVAGSFERGGWESTGNGVLQGAEVFEGTQAAYLASGYVEFRQNVELEQGVEYILQCYELGDPIRYRIFKDGALVEKSNGAGNAVPDSDWRTKTLSVVAATAGTYEIRLSTGSSVEGYVDSCSLRRAPSGATRFALQQEQMTGGVWSNTSRMANCEGSCLKLYCPV